MYIPDPHRRQAGLSLVELLMFIVIVGVGIAGILTVLNLTAQKSADPMIRKQMLSLAEAYLEEVQLRPFTYCDPDDPAVLTAASAAACATAEATAPQPATETRGSNADPFDNVGDYGGFGPAAVSDISGGALAALGAYQVAIGVAQESLEASIPSADSLRITVTVSGPGSEAIALTGYRLRYAPNSVP